MGNIDDNEEDKLPNSRLQTPRSHDRLLSNSGGGGSELNDGWLSDDYFKRLLEFILLEDTYRSKLLRISAIKRAARFSEAFPKRSNDRFEYVASGSYAHVYRYHREAQVTTTTARRSAAALLLDWKSKKPETSGDDDDNESSIIKLIDVYSDTLLKNLVGVSGKKSASTYEDVYNEFRISMTLSRLNYGVSNHGRRYKCPLFPRFDDCYMIGEHQLPGYFESRDQLAHLDFAELINLEQQPAATSDEEESGGHGESNATANRFRRSRLLLSEVTQIHPEVAAIKMEDCGDPAPEELAKLGPIEVLAAFKQLLLGFTIAETIYEFEHRDLHLGNLMVKKSKEKNLLYVFEGMFIEMPAHGILVKAIDTTFSRLAVKRSLYYRDLSHLFGESDLNNFAGKNNRLSHQDQTYQAMASEVQTDWSRFYPRTNIFWLIYIAKKFQTLVSKQKRSAKPKPPETGTGLTETELARFRTVQMILKTYINSLMVSPDLRTFFRKTFLLPELNHLVPILVLAENPSPSSYSSYSSTPLNSKPSYTPV